MEIVHVFISSGRFQSVQELRKFVDKTYTEDGEGIPSPFMAEVDFAEYEPGCIEAITSESGAAIPLEQLLAGSSYSDQWLQQLDVARTADAAICVFAPNELSRPTDCSLEYLGGFEYRA